MKMEAFVAALGEDVADPEEEAFLMFSQAIPSQALGMIDSKAPVVEINIPGKDLQLSIRQNPSVLGSNRKEGTTGAVVWKINPLFATWIASDNFLFRNGILHPDAVVLELGCGVSGVVALTLAPSVKRYIATDQDYVLKLLKQNIAENTLNPSVGSHKQSNKKKHGGSSRGTSTPRETEASTLNIETLTLDWEADSIMGLPHLLGQRADDALQGVDVLLATDCIYNFALIEPFVTTCAQICRLRSASDPTRPTVCIIGQQLRLPDVFEEWIKCFHKHFQVWRVPDELLTKELGTDSGFAVHAGILRGD